MNADRFFLEEVGTITKADNLRKREVQVNTRIHYAQRRWAFTDSMVWLCNLRTPSCKVCTASHRYLLTGADPPASFCPKGKHDDVSRFNLLREESEGYAKLLDALLRFEKAPQNVLHMKFLVRPNLQ